MKSIFQNSLKILAFVSLLVFISCDTKKNDSPSISNTSDEMFSEFVSEESFSQSWKLMEEGQILANNGGSIDAILKTLPDSTLVQINGSDILFFLKGSMPMLIELKGVSNNNSKNSSSGTLLQQRINPTALFTGINSFNSTIEETNNDEDVVGSQRGEVARQLKKAVLISPHIAEFGSDDDYYSVVDIFKNNKNYRGNISIRQSNLSLSDYEDWGQFDIVHISTHGKNFCGKIEYVIKGDINKADNQGKKECRSLLTTGIKHGYEKASEAYQFIKNSEYSNLVVVSTTSYYLRSTFFDHFYGKGLENKIWYFSACEMGQLSDMTSSMTRIHKNGHFIYWTNSVFTHNASRAAKSFYSLLFKNGLDAKKAYDNIPKIEKKDLSSSVTVIRDGEEITFKTKTNLKIINTGVLQHGVEIIDLIHPEENTMIKTGDFYPVEGNFGDGQKETIDLKVRLYGFTKAEFEDEKLKLSLKVDDETVLNKIQFHPNTSSYEINITDIEDNNYGIEVYVKNIEIADVGDKSDLMLKAYLHFDDEYFSIHSEKVNIKSEGILATVDDGESIAKFYYDGARNAVRVETDDSSIETYMDSEGYFYFHNNNEGLPLGWVKSKAMASMFMGNFSFTSVDGNEHVNDDDGKFNFPIIAWAQKHTTIHYSGNSNFKKLRIDCDRSKQCIRFEGIAGEETGHYATFNPNGKLIEMGQGQFKIEFEYGLYEVKLPIAAEISIPGFN